MYKKVSVIVPFFNSAAKLESCLRAIRNSAYPDYALIAVDDGSLDGSAVIAGRFADDVITHPRNRGEGASRNSGAEAAQSDILIFVDSDVLVRQDTIARIMAYFDQHTSIAALSGRLSKEHPHKNFFSQYKNLYLHYIFGLLPERVNFLYGSIHAIRKHKFLPYNTTRRLAADTELGLRLANRGQPVAFLRSLEVGHLKQYRLFSLLQNDFRIAFAWAQIFIEQKGFRHLFKNGTGFAHSPARQILGLILAVPVLISGLMIIINPGAGYLFGILAGAYFFLNYRFFEFLAKEKGWFFASQAVFFTFLDNLIMLFAVACGVFSKLFGWRPRSAGG